MQTAPSRFHFLWFRFLRRRRVFGTFLFPFGKIHLLLLKSLPFHHHLGYWISFSESQKSWLESVFWTMLLRVCTMLRKEESVKLWLGLPLRSSSNSSSLCKNTVYISLKSLFLFFVIECCMILLFRVLIWYNFGGLLHGSIFRVFDLIYFFWVMIYRLYWRVWVCWWSQIRENRCWIEW